MEVITVEKTSLKEWDYFPEAQECLPVVNLSIIALLGISRSSVKDFQKSRWGNLQAARKVEQGCQAWVAVPMLDINHAAEAHPASLCQLLKGESLRFP
jgi:hypothetical protein